MPAPTLIHTPDHVTRKALKDFTFSNGITIPAGASVSVATHNMHNDAVRTPRIVCGSRDFDWNFLEVLSGA
jgi:hypothetical protein